MRSRAWNKGKQRCPRIPLTSTVLANFVHSRKFSTSVWHDSTLRSPAIPVSRHVAVFWTNRVHGFPEPHSVMAIHAAFVDEQLFASLGAAGKNLQLCCIRCPPYDQQR